MVQSLQRSHATTELTVLLAILVEGSTTDSRCVLNSLMATAPTGNKREKRNQVTHEK